MVSLLPAVGFVSLLVAHDLRIAQTGPVAPVVQCGQLVPAPAAHPPDRSAPVLLTIALCFDRQGGVSTIDPQTYLYYLHVRPSRPSQGVWVPYDAQTESGILEDFRRLWATNFLDDLQVDVADYRFPNGVVGKLVTYHLEERQRVKIVDYVGSTKVDVSKIEEKLRDVGVVIRLDSFIDPALLRRVSGLVRNLYAEAGHQFAEVKPVITEVAGGPKLVHVRFLISEGPKVRIRGVEFVGNRAVRDDVLRRQLKVNREESFLSIVTRHGAYQEAGFADDAERIVGFYRDHGYIDARVGNPELKPLADSKDGKTRWVQLRIPVTEGAPHRIGEVTVAGNDVVKTEALKSLFRLRPGDYYSEELVRKGLEKAREVYGSLGFFEFTGYPDLTSRDPAAGSAQLAGPSPTAPVVDVTLRIQEGRRYYVNRISFTGNTTTRDEVIRRELQLLEGGVFDTEALKYSIRRLNQLAYFKAIEQDAIKVEKTSGSDDKVDVTLDLQEQNRNQLTFGAGISGLEGVFVSASFATSNFLGRGETVQVSAQRGARSNNYQVAFTEPYLLRLFDRPTSAGVDVSSRKIDYLDADGKVGYSEVRMGSSVTGGVALGAFTRGFASYGYEVIDVAVRDDLLEAGDDSDPGVPLFNPYLDEGRHTESRVTHSLVYSTVDNPFLPRRGVRLTGSAQVAGGFLGGTTNYVRPEAEAVVFLPHTPRTALGVRGGIGWVGPFGDATNRLPYYLRFFLGGETQIRGVDIRTVGPTDANNRALGGNKFMLFNAEYYLDVAGPVRLVLFHDAGQAFREGDNLDFRNLRTSSGVELRFLMPVMNVPFRLIYAWNLYRDSFQPPRTFKFAVGTTF